MLYQVTKRFTGAGVPLTPGDIVDTTGWRNVDSLKKSRFITETDAKEVFVKSLSKSTPEPQENKPLDTPKKKVAKKVAKPKSVLASRTRKNNVRKAKLGSKD
jgi:hypothetical protein